MRNEKSKMRNHKSEKGADHLLLGGYPRGMCVEDDPILADTVDYRGTRKRRRLLRSSSKSVVPETRRNWPVAANSRPHCLNRRWLTPFIELRLKGLLHQEYGVCSTTK